MRAPAPRDGANDQQRLKSKRSVQPASDAMPCYAICLLSLASACDATSDYRTPSSERKQRIVRAMSTGHYLTLRLAARWRRRAPNYQKVAALRMCT